MNSTTTEKTVPNLAEKSIHVCFLVLIILAIIAGNVLVVVIIRLDRRLHSPTFYFLGNLAIADFLVGIGYVPFYMAAVIKQDWVFGSAWCRGHAFVVSTSFNASLMTLCVVSVDRYLNISNPLRYYGIMTKKKTNFLILFIWLHSIFWASAPLCDWGETLFDSTTNTCRPNFAATGVASRIYGVLLVLFAFTLPVLVTIYSYIKIFRVAKDQSIKIAKESVTRSEIVSEHRPGPVRERKAHKTILIIIGAFVICWMPYTVGTSWKLLTGQALVSYWFAHLGLTLALSNSSLNPVIYTVRDRRFRRGLVKVVCRHRHGRSRSGTNLSHCSVALSHRAGSYIPQTETGPTGTEKTDIL